MTVRKAFLGIVAAALVGVGSHAAEKTEPTGLEVGETAPSFRLRLGGSRFDLSRAVRESNYVLLFIPDYKDCEPCTKLLLYISKTFVPWASQRGATVMALSPGTVPMAEDYLRTVNVRNKGMFEQYKVQEPGTSKPVPRLSILLLDKMRSVRYMEVAKPNSLVLNWKAIYKAVQAAY